MMPVKTMICDELPRVRAGLHTLLEISSEIEVVATTDSPKSALILARLHHPDTLIVGFAEQGAPVAEMIRGLEESDDSVLHAHEADDWVAELLRECAQEMLHRDATSAEVIASIRAVTCGMQEEPGLRPALMSVN